jgi:hypothetical protein
MNISLNVNGVSLVVTPRNKRGSMLLSMVASHDLHGIASKDVILRHAVKHVSDFRVDFKF